MPNISQSDSKWVEEGDAPQVVADKVVKAATDKKPKLRYPAGKQTRQVSVLLRFGPERLVAKILRKGNGLPA